MAAQSFEQLVANSVETHSLGQLGMLMDTDAESGHFVRSDGCLLAVIAVEGLPAIDRSDGDLVHRNEALSAALAALPTGVIFSATTYISKDISHATAAYARAGGSEHAFLREMEARRISLLVRGAEKPLLTFPGQEFSFRTRNIRTLMTIAVPPLDDIRVPEAFTDFMVGLLPRGARRVVGRWLQKDLGAEPDMTPSRARWMNQLNKQRRELRFALERLQIALTTVGCAFKQVGEEELIQDIRNLLYPRTGHRMQITDADVDEYICNRIPALPMEVCPEHGWVKSDGVYHRVATLKSGIPETWPGMLSMPNRFLNGHVALSALDHGFMTVTAVAKDKDQARHKMEGDIRKINGGLGQVGRDADATADNVRGLHWLGQSRGLMVSQVMLSMWGETPDSAEDRLNRTVETLKPSKITLRMETRAGPSYFFQAVPGNQIPPVPGARRDRLLADRQVADLCTLYGRSRGSEEGVMLLHNALGEAFLFSLWGGNNPCFLITGVPGCGKSVFAQALVMNIARGPNNPQILVIDKGKSFATETLSFQERGIYQNLARGLCRINVLAGTHADVASIASVFIQHLAVPPRTVPLSQSQVGLIDETIREVFEAEGKRPATTFFAYEELHRNFPGCWVHRAWKEMEVAYIAESTRKVIEQLYEEDATYKIYYRYRIRSHTDKDGVTHEIREARDIPRPVYNWLTNQRFQVRDMPHHVELLHEFPTQASQLNEHQLTAQLEQDGCIVHVATERDVQTLEKSQVVFQIPTALQIEVAQHERARIETNVEYRDATEDQIAGAVRRRVQHLKGVDAYRHIQGQAIMQHEVFLGDFGRMLERKSQESEDARDLQRRLLPYYGEGARAPYFDGPTSFDLEQCTIADFELGNLGETAGEHLLGAVVSALLQHFTLYITQEHLRGRRKVIVIDEAWQLTGHDVIAQSIKNLHRTGRKHGVAVGTISQSLEDYYSSETGRVLLTQAPNQLILEQSDTVVNDVVAKLGWTEEEREVLRSVKSKSGAYSQVLVRCREHKPPIFEVAINILDPYEYWIFTTRPEDVSYREELIEEHALKGMTEAVARKRVIDHLAEVWPRGYRP